MIPHDVKFRFTSKIEFITGSRKFRTRAQWPVSIIYTVDDNKVNVTQVLWDKCDGSTHVDITDFIMPAQLAGLAKEISDLFWEEEK